MRGSNRVCVSVYLDKDQLHSLDELKEKLDVPKSIMIRKGIDLAVAYFEELVEAQEKGLELLASEDKA